MKVFSSVTLSKTSSDVLTPGGDFALTSPVLSALQTVQSQIQAADKAGGVGISISLGSSSSQSQQNSSANTARGSSVTAGGSIQIAAVGDAQNSNLTVQGSRIEAGQTTSLNEDGVIDLAPVLARV